MEQQIKLPSKVEWPKLRHPRPDSGINLAAALFACISVILAIIVPGVADMSPQNRWLIAISVVLGVVVLLLAVWGLPNLWLIGRYFLQLKRHYGPLYEYARQITNLVDQQQAAASSLVGSLANIIIHPLPIVNVRKKGQDVILEIGETRLRTRWEVDSELVVFNPDSKILLGTFTITEVIPGGYLAAAVHIVNGLWWRDMRDHADKSSRPQTNAVAVLSD